MCAPCKVILDEGVAAMGAGGGPERIMAAMAEAVVAHVRQFPPRVQNQMSYLDLSVLRGEITASEWIQKMLELLEQRIRDTDEGD